MALSFTYSLVWLLNAIAPTIILYRIFVPVSSTAANQRCQRSYILVLLLEAIFFAGLFYSGIFNYNWQGMKRLLFIYWIPFFFCGYRLFKPYFYQYIFSMGIIGMLMFAMHTILINLCLLFVSPAVLIQHVLRYFAISGLLSLCLMPLVLRLFHLLFYQAPLLKRLEFWRYFCWLPGCFTLYSISLSQANLPLGHLYLQPRLLQIFAIIIIALTLYLSVKQVQKTLQYRTQIQNSLAYIDILSDYTQMLQGTQQRMRILRHDSRHQLLLLASLLQQGDADSALILLEHFRRDIQDFGIWQEHCSAACKKELQPIWQKFKQQGVVLSMDINLPHLSQHLERDLLPIIKSLLQATEQTLKAAPKEQRSLIFIAHQTNSAVLVSLRNNSPTFLHFDQHNLPTDAVYAEVTSLLQAFSQRYQATYQYNQEPGFISFHLRISHHAKEGGSPS